MDQDPSPAWVTDWSAEKGSQLEKRREQNGEGRGSSLEPKERAASLHFPCSHPESARSCPHRL